MAIAFVQDWPAVSIDADVNEDGTSTATATAGNFLVAIIAGDAENGTGVPASSISDSQGNTWQQALYFAPTAGSANVRIMYAANIAGGSTTITVHYENTAATLCTTRIREFSGIATTSPLDQTKTNNVTTTTTTPTTGASATTTQADELVIVGANIIGALTTVSAGSGYTNVVSNRQASAYVALEHKIVAATGAQTGTFGLAAARAARMALATFKASTSTAYTATPTDTVGLTDSITTGKVSTLVDNFDDGTIAPQWVGAYNATETGGRIRLGLSADNAYAGLPSANKDAVASETYVTWKTLPAASTSTEVYARHMQWNPATAGTGIGFDYSKQAGVMRGAAVFYTDYFDASPVTFTLTADMTTGITEAAGTVTLWTSTNGGATRTTVRTIATPSWWDVVYVQLESHRSADGVGDYVEWDNFNIAAGDLTSTATDQVGITDAAAVTQTNDRAATDTVGITDAINTVISLSAGVPIEPVGITDAVSTLYSIGYQAAPTDPVGITDSTALTQTNARTLGPDNVGITDSRALTQTNVRDLVDNVGITDAIALARTLDPFIDTVGITDSVETVIDFAPQPTVAPLLEGAIPVPLSVRLTTAAADVLLVEEIREVSFRSVVPGGFASATVVLDRIPWHKAPEIGIYGRMYIYDTRSGQTVWEGRVEDPGKSVDGSGFAWQVTAIGPSAHARDETFAGIWIDTTINHYQRFGGSLNASTVSTATDVFENEGVKVQFPTGTTVTNGSYVSGRTTRYVDAGLEVARVTAYATGGGTGTWTMDMYMYGPSGAELVQSTGLTTTPTFFRGRVNVEFSDGQTTPHLRMTRNTSSTTPDDNAFTLWTEVTVRTKLVDEEGTPVTTYSFDSVTASEVVQDVVGRHLPQYDALDAFIETTSDEITQLAYDSTTAADVFGDLISLSGDYYGAAWETVARSGKWRFEWKSWPTWVRYEAGIEDGWDSPGSAAGLYNECLVTWKNAAGREKTTLVTGSVPELTNAGLTRTALIDLGQEVGSAEAALAAGQAYLAQANLPSQNGRLTIARPILDADWGMMADPHMIRPGHLIRVRGVDAKAGALDADSRDGSTVFRIMATSFRASDGSVELELDSDALSTSKAIARLQTRRARH